MAANKNQGNNATDLRRRRLASLSDFILKITLHQCSVNLSSKTNSFNSGWFHVSCAIRDRRAVLSAVVSQQGVLVTPDPITESLRKRKSKRRMLVNLEIMISMIEPHSMIDNPLEKKYDPIHYMVVNADDIKDWEEVTVMTGELDEVQATAISELLNPDRRRVVTRQIRNGKDIAEAVYPTEGQRYRMIPILGDGNNCCTFLEDIFPIACHLGIPGTAYDPSAKETAASTPSKE
eukprot:jgi/Bigna1/70236/fgenesh1_pg.11_\